MTGKILENPQVYTSYLSLGSNEGDREMNIQSAVEKIGALDGTCVEAVSSIIETTPQGNWNGKPGRDFLNCCVRISTSKTPFQLLRSLKEIECSLGRDCSVTYNAAGSRIYNDRPIDIDILLYSDFILETPELKIPHPRMQERNFVMIPLREILDSEIQAEFNESLFAHS